MTPYFAHISISVSPLTTRLVLPLWHRSVCLHLFVSHLTAGLWCINELISLIWRKSAIKERGNCSTRQMEGANHCCEIEMTPNYHLAANMAVYICWRLSSTPPPNTFFLLRSSFLVCLLFLLMMMNLLRQVWNAALFFFLNVEIEKTAVVKQSPVSQRERQLPAVGNQWSFLQINNIQLWSMAHCRFLDMGLGKITF